MFLDCRMKLEEPNTLGEYAFTCCIYSIFAPTQLVLKWVHHKRINKVAESDSYCVIFLLYGYQNLWLTISSYVLCWLWAHHFPPHQNQTCWRGLVENALCKKNSSRVRSLFPLDGLGLPLLALWVLRTEGPTECIHGMIEMRTSSWRFCSAMIVPESLQLCVYMFLRVPQWHSKPDSPLEECSGCNITMVWREPVVVNRSALLILRRVLGSAFWLRDWRQSETQCDMWRLRTKKSLGSAKRGCFDNQISSCRSSCVIYHLEGFT